MDVSVEAVEASSYVDFVTKLEAELQQSNFKVVLKDLSTSMFSPQADKSRQLDFVLNCLLYCQQHLDTVTSGLKHLLLELITPAATDNVEADVRKLAVQLFHAYCTVQDAKLAAKVAMIFKLRKGDLGDMGRVVLAVQEMLQNPASYKAAVHIMMQFEGLDDAVDKSEVITQLVSDGQENLCQQWVVSLGRDYQVEFVEACVALDKLKPAARAVRQLGLQAEFPNIESLYRQRSLARLVGKQLWSVALSFVGNDTALQTTLVRDMADMGEYSLADDYRKQLGLPESVLSIDPEQVAAQEAARRQQYLQLEEYLHSSEQLLFVDNEAGLMTAAAMLQGSDVLGLDVEWKPSHTAGLTSPAAVLQVASRNAAVLFDLIALAQQHPAALDACLQPLFSSTDTVKLGFEVSGDLAKLANSWPQVEAFRCVCGVLDLRPLWVAYGLHTRGQGTSARLLSAVSLSTLCRALLGKPLDKSQQMSDWTARPLTNRQLQYAALDAVVLPPLFDVLSQELGPQKHEQLMKQHLQTFSRNTGSKDVTPDTCGTAASASSMNEDSRDDVTQQSSCQGVKGSASIPVAGLQTNMPIAVAPEPGLPRVIAHLEEQGIGRSLYRLHAPTGQSVSPLLETTGASRAVCVPRTQVAKTMVVLVDNKPMLVVTRGDHRIDMHKLAAVLGVRRKVIRLAPDSVAAETTGFAPGGIPPLGHGRSLPILLDLHLMVDGLEGAAAGADYSSIEKSTGLYNVYHLEAMSYQAQQTVSPKIGGVLADGCGDHLQCMASGNSVGVGGAAGHLQTPQQSDQQHLAVTEDTISREAGDAELLLSGRQRTVYHSVSITMCSHKSCPGDRVDSKLYVQCGRSVLAVLTAQQLLQLTQAQVADIADTPDNTSTGFTPLGSTTAHQGQQQDPHTSGGQQSVPRFLVDSMLGRLCRWLRALGVDAQFVDAGGTLQQLQQLSMSDRQQQQQLLVQQIQEAALQEGRLFLTRDSKLAARRDVGGGVYLLDTDDTSEQLAEVSRHFGIRFDEQTAMSRCSSCNAAAFQMISKQEAAAHVPQRVMDLVDEFWKCGRCGKVFWMGPKSYAALELLGGLFADGKKKPTPLRSQMHIDGKTNDDDRSLDTTGLAQLELAHAQ